MAYLMPIPVSNFASHTAAVFCPVTGPHGPCVQGSEDCRVHIARKPSEYLRQVWFDTLVFDKEELDALVRSYGAHKLCLGTDYPFDMAEPDPVAFHDCLDTGSREKMLGGNAAELLGLEAKANINTAETG